MSIYPQALWRPVFRYRLGESSNQPMARYDIAVVHIEDGTWSRDEAFNHYNTSGNPIPHFRLHVPTAVIDQYVDTAYRSSACLDGNPRCIAIEMYGLGHGDNADLLPDDAAEALARWLAWCATEHGIPAREAGDSRPTSRGFGWHRLGIDGNFPQAPGLLLGGRVPGGEHWSTSGGKTCPTTPLIHQLHDQIIPSANALVRNPHSLEDDMPQFDDKIPGRKDGATVRDAFDASLDVKAALSDFRTSSRDRDAAQTKLLRSLVSDLPDQVAAAVEAHLPTDGSTITRAMIREAARKGAASGVTDAYRKAFGTDTPATG